MLGEINTAILFWTFLCFLCCFLSIMMLIFIFSAIIIYIYFIIVQNPISDIFPTSEKLLELEDKIITSSCNSKVKHIWKDICIDNIVVHAHALMINSNNKDAQTLLLIHGNFGTAISWVSCFDHLSPYFNIIALDLPGYGRTYSTFHSYTTTQSLDFYAKFIASFLNEMNINKVYILAHSYGGFLSAHFANKFPHMISHLLLLNTAGLLPTLSNTGAFWAFIFKMSLLYSPRFFGELGIFVFYALFKAFINNDYYLYWFYISSSCEVWGDRHMANFITFSGTRAYWNLPMFEVLNDISQKIPISTIWGELDSIIPSKQGIILNDIFDIPCIIIENTGHSPIHGCNANKLCKIVNTEIKKYCNCIFQQKVKYHNKFFLSKKKWEERYYSTFNILQTDNTIYKLYDDIYSYYINQK